MLFLFALSLASCQENEDLRCCCLLILGFMSRMRIFVDAGCLILGFISRKWGHLLLLFALSYASCLEIRTFVAAACLGCPLKLVSIWNNRNWNGSETITIRNKTFVSVRFYTETESFDAQCDREHILFCFFRFVLVCFETVCFGCRFYTQTESSEVLIEPKQTEDQTKQFDREHILVLFRKFRFFLVFFSLFQNSSVFFSCFDIGSKHRNKPVKAACLILGFMSRKWGPSLLLSALSFAEYLENGGLYWCCLPYTLLHV